jgi:RNA polymerase sigma-70 factor (ECF subfamily)
MINATIIEISRTLGTDLKQGFVFPPKRAICYDKIIRKATTILKLRGSNSMSDANSKSDPMQVNDRDLILRAQEGNMIAFEELVQKYDRKVFSIASTYVQSSEDAKDIYQEVFVRVYKGLSKFEMRSEFSTWLYRITTNVCLTHRARSRKHQHASLDDGHDEEDGHSPESIGHASGTDQRLINAEISNNIDQALSSLSARQRLVFTLRHYEGKKLKEIATMMKLTEGTVKRYLFTATERMRKQLKDFTR